MKKTSNLVKSPLHPSALTINDLFVGRKLWLIDLAYGQLAEYTVVGPAYIGRHPHEIVYDGIEPSNTQLLIDLRKIEIFPSGTPRFVIQTFSLAELSVMPIDSYLGQPVWNQVRFLIDPRKQHLLPEPNPEMLYESQYHFDYLARIAGEQEGRSSYHYGFWDGYIGNETWEEFAKM